jgi:hypothetical protein
MAIDPTPPEPALHEHLLTGLHVRPLDQRLPGGQRHQRQRGGLDHRQRGRFDRQVVLVDRDQLRERADAVGAGPRIYLITRRESSHGAAYLKDHTGQVVAEDERGLVRQHQLELAVLDLDVEHVHPRCVDLDEDVTITDHRVGHLTGPQ